MNLIETNKNNNKGHRNVRVQKYIYKLLTAIYKNGHIYKPIGVIGSKVKCFIK